MFSRIKTTSLNKKTLSLERSVEMIIINRYILDVPTSIHIHIKAHSILLTHKSNKLYTWSLNSSLIFVYVVRNVFIVDIGFSTFSVDSLRYADEHIFFSYLFSSYFFSFCWLFFLLFFRVKHHQLWTVCIWPNFMNLEQILAFNEATNGKYKEGFNHIRDCIWLRFYRLNLF